MLVFGFEFCEYSTIALVVHRVVGEAHRLSLDFRVPVALFIVVVALTCHTLPRPAFERPPNRDAGGSIRANCRSDGARHLSCGDVDIADLANQQPAISPLLRGCAVEIKCVYDGFGGRLGRALGWRAVLYEADVRFELLVFTVVPNRPSAGLWPPDTSTRLTVEELLAPMDAQLFLCP